MIRSLPLVRLLLIVLFGAGLSSCLQVPPPDLPTGWVLTPLGRAAEMSLIRWSPDGRWLAVGGTGLDLYAVDGSTHRRLSDQPVSAIAWHASGQQLAAALSRDFSSTLLRFGIDGQKLEQQSLDGYCADLFWQGDRFLLIEAQLELYRFGGDLKLSLRPWDASSGQKQLLYGRTLPPKTAATLKAHPYFLRGARLNQDGDMLAFLLIRDPPAFAPSQQLLVRHLSSGSQWTLANLTLPAGPLSFSADGETLMLIDGSSTLHRLSVWGGEDQLEAGLSGQTLAISPGGRHRWHGDRIEGEGSDLMAGIKVTAVAFAPDGASLAWVRDGRVELLQGLSPDPAQRFSENVSQRLKTLRDWRARGLIDENDYATQRRRIVQP